MPNTLKATKSNVICGLGTWTHTTAQTGPYFISVRCTEVPASGVTITLSQSGGATNSVVSTAPVSSQGIINFSQIFQCVVGDVLSVAIASSNANDRSLNGVKTVVALMQGQGQ